MDVGRWTGAKMGSDGHLLPFGPMELLLSLALGIGLSAATGFRIFLPALLASGAALMGWITPDAEFAWLATWPAFAVFATASVVEIGAYYVPWVDNALDTIAVPGSVLAGGLLATSFLEIDSPMLQWVLPPARGRRLLPCARHTTG